MQKPDPYTPREGCAQGAPSGRWRAAGWRARLLIVIFLAVIMVGASPVPAARAPGPPAALRQVNCGLTELVCRMAEGEGAGQVCPGPEQSCDLDLTLYRAYMARLARGVTVRPLHPRYRQLLAPHYPHLDLAAVRLGYSPRQPLRNATTDCLNIYFNDAAAVGKFVEGRARLGFRGDRPDPDSTQLDWLLHELRHAEQCLEAGGREGYARRWFSELSRSGLLMLLQGEGSQQRLHDGMEMEEDADRVSAAVLARLAHNVDARGGLAPAITPGLVTRTGPLRVGSPVPVMLTAAAAGGADPIRFTWSMQRPGRDRFYQVPELEGRAFRNMMVWLPSLDGVYRVKVTAYHPGGHLAPVERTVEYYVAPPALAVCSNHYTL